MHIFLPLLNILFQNGLSFDCPIFIYFKGLLTILSLNSASDPSIGIICGSHRELLLDVLLPGTMFNDVAAMHVDNAGGLIICGKLVFSAIHISKGALLGVLQDGCQFFQTTVLLVKP